MMILAVQYAIQPRLSRKYISPKIKKQSVALVEEVVKTSFAAAIFFSKPNKEVQSALKDWSLSSSLACAGLPAMLYALQGVMQYVSYQHLDPVTFNGLTQTKTLSAAFCCWLIMKKIQSPLQMVALSILFCSALVFQGYIRLETFWNKAYRNTEMINDTSSSATTKRRVSKKPTKIKAVVVPTTNSSSKKDDWLWRGVIPCLGAAFLSGLAGALSQKGLQLTGIRGRDPFLFTIEISLFSAITLMINMLRTNFFSELDWQKQRAYWNWKTLIPIFMKASSGVITALVHKYAGSVSKGFALMFGLVLSNMIQLTTKQESLQSYQVLGTFMIMLSTWLHFTNPP
jgi:UDP-sugar transporter A1/2/3